MSFDFDRVRKLSNVLSLVISSRLHFFI